MTVENHTMEYLQRTLRDPNWWHNANSVAACARILEELGYFNDRLQVISYFEGPWHYAEELKKIAGVE